MLDLKLADGPAGDQKLCKMPIAVLEVSAPAVNDPAAVAEAAATAEL